MANTKIKIKQSSVSGNIPTASQLDQGELALNTADQKMYSKDSNGVIFEVGASSGGTYDMSGGTYDMGDYNRDVYFDAGDSDDVAFITQGAYDGGGAE